MISFLNIKVDEYQEKINLRIDSLKNKINDLKLMVEKKITDSFIIYIYYCKKRERNRIL